MSEAGGAAGAAGARPAAAASALLGATIRRERLARDWSQSGLCRGICATSYLSKIERGEAEPSREVTDALLARLGTSWHDDEAFLARADGLLGRCLEAALSLDEDARPACAAELAACAPELAASPRAAEAALAEGLLAEPPHPADDSWEPYLDERHLALQRSLQGRDDEACRLWPCGLTYLMAGLRAYDRGEKNYATARDRLRRAFELAAAEGRARVMLRASLFLGNCACNQLDLEDMENNYRVARRLATALGDAQALAGMGYNAASAQLECGQYEPAYAYLSALESPTALDLHKLAVCCEGMGRADEARSALDRAFEQLAADAVPGEASGELVREMCEVVRLRLEHADYLSRPEYGRALRDVFERCRAERPIGYAAFHLPWVLEWLTAHRQYRAAYELSRDFPVRRATP